MNLIEKLGGYEAAKKQADEVELVIKNGYKSAGLQLIRDALLEHRRQNNIFEEGDRVVTINFQYKKVVCTISDIYEHKIFENGAYVYSTFVYKLAEWSYEYWFSAREIRHATDEEIAQGFRDEDSIVCWSCDSNVLIKELSANDGFCPVCDREIDLDDN